jgi:methyl-accepting chemotaxis protein
LPNTTGSNETDELLGTLHRNSNQLKNLINLMDSVASGKTDIALTPLQNSDRLSVSFQKLVAKVTDSIDAKNELNTLHAELDSFRADMAAIRGGDLGVVLDTTSQPVKDFAETINLLSQRLNLLVGRVSEHAGGARNSAAEARRTIGIALDQHDVRTAKISRLASAFREYPNTMQSISSELDAIVLSIKKTQAAVKGADPQRDNVNSVNSLRKQINEAIKRLRTLSEHSVRIEQTAKAAEDLSRRSNLISLNASVQRSEAGIGKRGSAVAEEIDFLAVRAENINREISEINKTLRAEIESAAACLKIAGAEASEVSVRTIRDGDSQSDLLRIFERIGSLSQKIASSSTEQANDRENALQMFTASANEAGQTAETLRECENDLEALNASFESLVELLSDLRVQANGSSDMPSLAAAAGYTLGEGAAAGGEIEG